MQSDEIPEPACSPGTRTSLLLREVDVARAALLAASFPLPGEYMCCVHQGFDAVHPELVCQAE